MAGDYSLPNLYQPSYKTNQNFDPTQKIPHYIGSNLISARQMGITVNPAVANQLGELSKALNQGVVPVEVGTIEMGTWENIPKEHFEEMRRKADLAGAQVSLHAPINGMDPSGFGERGWDEQKRELVERQYKDVLDKAALLSSNKSKEPIPVTIHGSSFTGSTWRYKEVDGKREKQYDTLMVVDKVSGEPMPLKESKMFRPGGDLEKGYIMTPEESLTSANHTKWRNDIDSVVFKNETAERTLHEIYPVGRELYLQVEHGQKNFEDLLPTEKKIYMSVKNAEAHVHDAKLGVDSLFNKAVEYSKGDTPEDQKKLEKLRELSQEYVQDSGLIPPEEFEKLPEDKKQELYMKRVDIANQSYAIQKLAEGLREIQPEIYTPVEKFSTEKASETFSNLALHGFKTHKDKAPMISIENLDQGRFGFSEGEDLKNLVEASREKFIEKARNEGFSEKKAKEAAEKLIGVTFDVGHLNIAKKQGYTDEDLVNEAKAVSKYVKHVHLTDNFGHADSHLPVGMGNVPVKELLEALGDEGKRARKINEIGGWFQLSDKSPYATLLQAAGSPLYSSSDGPYWSETTGFQQSYHSGYGQVLPSVHYESFGAGFSRLPTDLGGSMGGGGDGGRMGGGF